METAAQLVINGLVAGTSYGLVALSFAIVYNTAHFFHFAHGAIYTLGAYAAYAVMSAMPVGISAALAIGAGAAVIVGGVAELVVYRPLRRRKASQLILLLGALGLFLMLQNGVAMIFGSSLRLLPESGVQMVFTLSGGRITGVQVTAALVSLVLFAAVVLFLLRTTFGRKLRAVGSDPELARIFGVEPDAVIFLAFALGSALAGIAAVLGALDTGLFPTMGFGALLMAVVGMIVGGVGSYVGSYWGGVVVGFTQQLGAWLLPSKWQDLLVYLLLVGILLVRPQGLLGQKPKTVSIH